MNNFDVGFNHTQFAAVQYSGSPRKEFGFNQVRTMKQLKRAIKNMEYMGGNTATGAALKFTLENVFTGYGARPTAKQVAIVITDGESLQEWTWEFFTVGKPILKIH